MVLGGLGACAYFMFVFNPTVTVPSTEILGQSYGGGQVNNIGLMADRQNGIIVGGIVAVIGALMALFANRR